MLGFLCVGLVAYVWNLKRIILSSFLFSAIYCVFLKSASNNNLKIPEENNEIKLSVAHINVSSAEESYEIFAKELKNKNLDIISFQEVKPDWSRTLKAELREEFPFVAENVRIDEKSDEAT